MCGEALLTDHRVSGRPWSAGLEQANALTSAISTGVNEGGRPRPPPILQSIKTLAAEENRRRQGQTRRVLADPVHAAI